EIRAMDMGPEMGTYRLFGWNGQAFGGAFNKPSHMAGPPFWLPYIKVDDSKKTAARVAPLGGRIINGPNEVPGGDWIAQGLDREGGIFAVHSAAQAASGATKKAAPAARAVKPIAKKTAGKAVAVKQAARKKKGTVSTKRAATPPRRVKAAKKG